MPEIAKEYPDGQHILEMELVRMLSERRCWFDYMEIGTALQNIRQHADSMKKEHDHLNANGGNSAEGCRA